MISFHKYVNKCIASSVIFGSLYLIFNLLFCFLICKLFLLSDIMSLLISIGFTALNIIMGYLGNLGSLDRFDKIVEKNDKYYYLFSKIKSEGEKFSSRIKKVDIKFIEVQRLKPVFMGSPAVSHNDHIYCSTNSSDYSDELFCAICGHELGHSVSCNFLIIKFFYFSGLGLIVTSIKKYFRIFVSSLYLYNQNVKNKLLFAISYFLFIFFLLIYIILTLPEIIFLAIPYQMEEYKADYFSYLCGYGEWLKEFFKPLNNKNYTIKWLLESFQHPSPYQRMKRICKIANLSEEYIDYIFMNNNTSLVKYLGDEENFIVPSFVNILGDGKNILSKKIKIIDCNNAYMVKENVFSYCHKLKEAKMVNVTDINLNAFRGSGVEKIIVSSKLKQIGEYAFTNCEYLKTIEGLNLNSDGLECSYTAFIKDYNLDNATILTKFPKQIDLRIPDGTICVANIIEMEFVKILYIPSSVKFINIDLNNKYVLNKSNVKINCNKCAKNEEELYNLLLNDYPLEETADLNLTFIDIVNKFKEYLIN